MFRFNEEKFLTYVFYNHLLIIIPVLALSFAGSETNRILKKTFGCRKTGLEGLIQFKKILKNYITNISPKLTLPILINRPIHAKIAELLVTLVLKYSNINKSK